MLTRRHVEDVCMWKDGSLQCRYLEEARNGKFLCLKLSKEREIRDELTEEYIQQWKQIGLDPLRGNTPTGDNCKGYRVLLDKPQGYDVEDR